MGQFVPTDFWGVFVLIGHGHAQLYTLNNSAILGFLGEDLDFFNERPQQHLLVSGCHFIKEQGEIAQHLENVLLGQLILLDRYELVVKLRQIKLFLHLSSHGITALCQIAFCVIQCFLVLNKV